jgi:hypothetical protein
MPAGREEIGKMKADGSIPTTIKDRWLLAITLTFILAFLHPLSSLVPSARPPALSALKGLSAAKQPADAKKIESALTKLPIYFAPNAGQLDERVKYSASGAGYNFYLTEDGVTYSFTTGAGDEAAEGYALKLSFAGANPGALIEGRKEQAGKVNYLLGNDQNEWQTNVPTFGQVAYKELYPGVDLTYQGAGGKLKYEFIVAPGADANQIQMAYSGADSLKVDKAGNLVIATPWGTLKDEKPFVYQTIGGKKTEVPAAFAVKGKTVGFTLGNYDRNRPLIIDPGLVYSTFLGAGGSDGAYSIAVDVEGNTYVTGSTDSADFPTTAGAHDGGFNSGYGDVFVTKLDADGGALVYSTFLGGSGNDSGPSIAVDAAGNAYVTGSTGSADFPTTAGALDQSHNGDDDVFVTKLNAAGSALTYSTFLGGGSGEAGHSIAVDGEGSVYVTGYTWAADFPTTAGALDQSRNGSMEAFVTKLNAAGSALTYSTFLGGGSVDAGYSIAVDGEGSAYVTGVAYSTDFPTTAGALDQSHNGSMDAFVAKLNAAGSALTYSTFLGGGNGDYALSIAVDAPGNAYLTGKTLSSDFPTTTGALDQSHNGDHDVFVTKLNSVGNSLVYSTFLGSSGSDEGLAVAVDAAGNAYVTGYTYSTDFPTTTGALDQSFNGSMDAFVAKLNAAGSGLTYSTFLGGGNWDGAESIAVDGAGNAYVTGWTDSADFPTTAGALDGSFNGGDADGFVIKLALPADTGEEDKEPPAPPSPPSSSVPVSSFWMLAITGLFGLGLLSRRPRVLE